MDFHTACNAFKHFEPISSLTVDTVDLHSTLQAISVTGENKVRLLLESCTHQCIV
jgi:hypothetical protein